MMWLAPHLLVLNWDNVKNSLSRLALTSRPIHVGIDNTDLREELCFERKLWLALVV